MERERKSQKQNPPGGPSTGSTPDLNISSLEEILRKADAVMDKTVNSQPEQQLNQLRQSGGE